MSALQIALGSLVTASPVIANGQQSSGGIAVAGMVPVLLTLPAAFTGTALTFEVSDALAGTYTPLYGMDGNAVSMTVAQGRTYAIDPANFQGILFMKIKSGSAEGGARTLTLSLKGM